MLHCRGTTLIIISFSMFRPSLFVNKVQKRDPKKRIDIEPKLARCKKETYDEEHIVLEGSLD